MVTCVAVVVFAALYRIKDPGPSIMASVFVACWVPFLISFAVLLLETGPEAGLFGIAEGNWRLVVVVLLVVANDTFGYIVGVLFGRHPMAPKVSPKKSWELCRVDGGIGRCRDADLLADLRGASLHRCGPGRGGGGGGHRR